MSSPAFNSPSPPNRSDSPLRSERLRTNPNARAYLLRIAGQDILVTLEEAREWFQQGYTIYNPDSRQLVDIGAVPVPSYAEGQGAFVREEKEEDDVRRALDEERKKSESEKSAGHGNGAKNGFKNGGHKNSSPGGGGGVAA